MSKRAKLILCIVIGVLAVFAVAVYMIWALIAGESAENETGVKGRNDAMKRLTLLLLCFMMILPLACSTQSAVPESVSEMEPTAVPVLVPTDKQEVYSFGGSYELDDAVTVLPYILHCYADGTLVLECHENLAGSWDAVSDTELHIVIDGTDYTAKYSEIFKIFSFRYKDIFDGEEISLQLQTVRDPAEVAKETNDAMIASAQKDVKRMVEAYAGHEDEIVFYDASHFVRWKTLEADMAPYPVQNKSFGGSNDVSRYYYMKELVYDANPKILVTLNDTNNWTSGQTLDMVLPFREKMLKELREALPDVVVIYLSTPPNPLRYFGAYHDNCVQSDLWTQEYCESHDGFVFLDIATPLTDNGNPVDAYWCSDHLHLSEEGYAILARVVKAKIDEICAQYSISFD